MIKQCLILFISNIIFWIQRIGARAHTNNTQSYPYLPLCYEHVRRTSKYTINHPRTHSDFRSRDSSTSFAWEILMTNNHVVVSWADRSRTLFSNTFYVLWSISNILWPVKRDHLTEHILVLIYCHSHDNNRLGTFRIVFVYASRFYYPNHVFDNSGRITIHRRFINLNMHRNNKW